MSKATGPQQAKANRRIIARYAPSPTGVPHIGNIRTALFNYLFAKGQGGQFLLRIEDTDRNRMVDGAVEKIKNSLDVLGLTWDGEEIYQSKRLEIYDKHLQILKERQLAYEDEGAWRFKIEKNKVLEWIDAVHGSVSFKSDVLEDFIIVKSDGFPTYHFASVVDDHLMEISHVFRGDEWIPSTPKHILLYHAFGWEMPTFVHLPPILGPDHKKLSKRDGAKSVIEYVDEGFLPEAIVNFLAFLGWSPKDEREVFSLEDLLKEFSLERINKNSPVFSLDKLNWFNGQWIRTIDDRHLAKKISDREKDYPVDKIVDLVPLVKDRMSTLGDFKKIAGFLLSDKLEIEVQEILVDADVLADLANSFEELHPWNKEKIQEIVNNKMNSLNLKKPEMYRSIGVAISGSKVTPPIFDSLEKLGKEETVRRLKDAASNIKKNK